MFCTPIHVNIYILVLLKVKSCDIYAQDHATLKEGNLWHYGLSVLAVQENTNGTDNSL